MTRNRWSTLTVLALAQFMVVLDVTVVNVALPEIQTDLGFSADALQWVISAYTLVFGGFLLLGGRMADLLGRRRMFLTGLALFTGGSLLAGLSPSAGALIAARSIQGLGGALLSPAALSLLTVTFPAGRDRNFALGIWGGLAGLGGTLGVVLGGVLVDAVGWEWIFFVNVPIGVALILITPLYVGESRVQAGPRRTFDVVGAVLATGGLLAIVLGVIRAEPLGWGSTEVVALLGGGVTLLAAFLTAESRSSAPLVPLRLFRSRAMQRSSLALALNGGAFLAMFFLTALFLQQVRGDSALDAGLHFLPMGFAAIAGATAASTLVTRIGTRPVHVAGAVLSVIGLALLARSDATSSYAGGVLPGLLLFGVGLMGVGVANQINAVADVEHHEAGAASGLVSSAYQVGGALGLAVITTLATSRVSDALASGAGRAPALVDGFQRGLVVAAAFAAVNLLIGLPAASLRPDADRLAEATAGA